MNDSDNMDKIKIVWTETFQYINGCEKNEEHEQIIGFIQDQLMEHAIELGKIGFMGTVYSRDHISVRSPGLLELAFSAIYHQSIKSPAGFMYKQRNGLITLFMLIIWSIRLRFQRSSNNSRYQFLSTQRLQLVDERETGIEKMNRAFRATQTRLGIVCWYGVDIFEIMLVSNPSETSA